MKFSDYLDEYQKDSNDFSLYLKDWHFFRDFPDYKGFSKSVYFTFDWLNEFWDQRKDAVDDYRFVYFGPAGTSTPFHVDVLRSYSWSVNVHGRKEWILVPPGHENEVKDKFGNFPCGITNQELCDKIPGSLRVQQEANEVLFVPSGWHHQVLNLTDTLSINNNWCNAWNVKNVWRFLKEELLQVQKEIEDVKEVMDNWSAHCQVLLRANCGMNYIEFCEMLITVGQPRHACLQKLVASQVPFSSGAIDQSKDKYSVGSYTEALKKFCLHSCNEKQTLSCSSTHPHAPPSLLEDMQRICHRELHILQACLSDVIQTPEFRECAPAQLARDANLFLSSLCSLKGLSLE
jgi:hypothetical protein